MNQIPYKAIITLSTIYGGIASGLYLYGYWGSFDINIFEFVSFSDFLKLSIFPLLGSLFFFIIYAAISQISLVKSFPPGGGADTKLGRFGLKYWRIIEIILLIIIILFILFIQHPFKWYIVAFLLFCALIPLTHMNFFIHYIPNPKLRSFILLMLTLPFVYSFAYGRQEACLIKSGHAKQILDVPRSFFQFQWDEKNQVAYLGYTGEYFAFYELLTKSVILIKPKQGSPLVFMKTPIPAKHDEKP